MQLKILFFMLIGRFAIEYLCSVTIVQLQILFLMHSDQNALKILFLMLSDHYAITNSVSYAQ